VPAVGIGADEMILRHDLSLDVKKPPLWAALDKLRASGVNLRDRLCGIARADYKHFLKLFDPTAQQARPDAFPCSGIRDFSAQSYPGETIDGAHVDVKHGGPFDGRQIIDDHIDRLRALQIHLGHHGIEVPT